MPVSDEYLKKMGKKIVLTFYPFFLIMTGLILFISIINWIIFIRPEKFNSNPDILYSYTSLFLAGLMVLLFRHCAIYRLDSDIGSRILYCIILSILIATPTYYSQIVLEDFSRKIVHLGDVSEIYEHKAAKFLSVDTYRINISDFGYYFSAVAEYGPKKGHASVVLDRYFVFPVFSQNYQSPVIWAGIRYHGKKDIDSSKSSLEARKAEFITETNKKIDKLNIGKFNYLELLTDNDINNGLCVAQENSKLRTICQRQVLLAHYEPIQNQIIEELGDFITALVISSLIWFLIILLPLLREIDD